MNQDELYRLRGEQVTLQTEQREIAGQIEAERAALLTLTNRLHPGRGIKTGWLDAEVARVRRLHQLAERYRAIDERLDELRPITGM